jgi:hypothetical protein
MAVIERWMSEDQWHSLQLAYDILCDPKADDADARTGAQHHVGEVVAGVNRNGRGAVEAVRLIALEEFESIRRGQPVGDPYERVERILTAFSTTHRGQ